MGKKRQKGQKRGQQQLGFQELLANQTLKKFQPYINQMVNQAAQQIAAQQKQLLENLYLRVRVIEDILIDKFEDVSTETMANEIATLEDKLQGMENVEGVVEEGDRVRFQIATKAEDQEEFQGENKMMVDNVGSGQTIGTELEGAMVGMKAGETKEFQFGKDKKMTAKITVDRVSRRPKQEENKEETADASANEGQ